MGGGWWDEFFTGPWLEVQRRTWSAEQSDAQGAQIAALLALSAGERVLDAPCGEGRIARALARRGLRVTGLDASEPLLAEARDRADAEGLAVELVRGDLREIPRDGVFEAAICVWGSFGYFDEVGDLAFATGVQRALAAGGRFLIDVASVETLLPMFQARNWFEVQGTRVLETRRYDPIHGRLEQDWTFLDGGREITRSSSIRLYSCPELCALLRRAGFGSFEAFGGLDGSPFGLGARRLVLVATKQTG